MYKEHKEGFYVFAPKSKFKNYIELIKYVTFWYQMHEDDKIVIEKVHAYEFISRLIIHIPEENFKYIRFYGAYCNSTKCHKSFTKIINDKAEEFKEKANKWRMKIMSNFNVDPLSCPICKKEVS